MDNASRANEVGMSYQMTDLTQAKEKGKKKDDLIVNMVNLKPGKP